MRVAGLVLVGLLWFSSAEAATCYVRDGGTATGSSGCDSAGGNWNTANAYDQVSSAEAVVARGDTIFVADGTYASTTFNVAASGTTPITICKATVSTVDSPYCPSAHGTSTGWVDTFGDGTATFTTQLSFSSNYWTWSGQTGGGPNNWYGPFGFKITSTATTPLIVVGAVNNFTLSVTGIIVRHYELQGNLDATGGGSNAQDGIGSAWNRSNFTASYFWSHDLGRTHWWSGTTDAVIEYGVTGNFNATGPQHSEILSMANSTTGAFIMRYNLFTSVFPFPATGGIGVDTQAGGSFHFYGNVIWADPQYNKFWECTNAGIFFGWDGGGGERWINLFVYNNTFADVLESTVDHDPDPLNEIIRPCAAFNDPAPASVNVNGRNTLMYDMWSPGTVGGFTTFSHGHFILTSTVGTSATTGSGDPFVNRLGADFHLTAATPAGFDVGAGPTGCTIGVNCYNVDMYGVTRGVDGTWDRGAIEFSVGGDITPPVAPTGVTVQ